jgi:hypothetical protein
MQSRQTCKIKRNIRAKAALAGTAALSGNTLSLQWLI